MQYSHNRRKIHKMHTSRDIEKGCNHFASLNDWILNWNKGSAYVPFNISPYSTCIIMIISIHIHFIYPNHIINYDDLLSVYDICIFSIV